VDLEPVDVPVEAPPVAFTSGEVLAAWRAAERRLEQIPAESPEHAEIEAEIERFRAAYRDFFRR
jgi:hypothetical protein